MKTVDIQDLEKLEKKHWWHISKREAILSCAKKFAKKSDYVLEIGAGSGSLLSALAPFGKPVAVDMSEAAIVACQSKGIKETYLAKFEDFTTDKKFGVIIAADIIEHIENDREAIAKIKNLLEPGGICIIHVPAFQFLYSYWDKRMGHYRRYSLPAIKNLLTSAGFDIELATYRLEFFMPLVALFRKITKPSEKSDFDQISFMNGIFLTISRLELFFINNLSINMPFGLSVLLIARKRSAV